MEWETGIPAEFFRSLPGTISSMILQMCRFETDCSQLKRVAQKVKCLLLKAPKIGVFFQ